MKRGGKLFESGGFGCLFRPQLKCNPKFVMAGDNRYFGDNGVSKLMPIKYAMVEYNEIKRFIPILKTIPNYSKYFIISDYTLCRPDNLTLQDVMDYDTQSCQSLSKKFNITSKNINQHLDELLSINMPFGGEDVDSFIKKIIYNKSLVVIFNEKMIDLLTNAIIPMNKRGIYHVDIKSDNILVNIENGKMMLRLIDWGLSVLYIPNVTNDSQYSDDGFTDEWKYIPSKIRNRPFQFNIPFSFVFLSTKFNYIYNSLLISKNGKITDQDIKEFIIGYFQNYININKLGHVKLFNTFFKYNDTVTSIFLDNDNPIRLQNLRILNKIDIIYEYLYKILIKFTRPYSFDILGYFNNVYIKNLDVWGFVMSYIALIENATDLHYPNYNNKIKTTVISLLNILLKYSDTPIDIAEIKKTILYLNYQLANKKTKIRRTRKTIKRRIV
jgi:hypothetical protein